MAPFTSLMAMTGSSRVKRRKRVKKSPKEPSRMATSTRLGVYIVQELGRKSRCRLETTMTKRSNHIPTFTRIETVSSTGMLRRRRRTQSSWGMATLQATMIQ